MRLYKYIPTYLKLVYTICKYVGRYGTTMKALLPAPEAALVTALEAACHELLTDYEKDPSKWSY